MDSGSSDGRTRGGSVTESCSWRRCWTASSASACAASRSPPTSLPVTS